MQIESSNIYKHRCLNNNPANKVTFGMIHGDCSSFITECAIRAEKVYELRKRRPFFKLFPFLNIKPKTEFINNTTYLKGEYTTSIRDVEEYSEMLNNKILNLINKQNKTVNKA